MELSKDKLSEKTKESIKAGITVKGAREHNLKDIDVFIPRNQMTVITGLSGSGKSSVAFDIIYAEGQRRYVESLSAYARNFMEQLKKPNVDLIQGLQPAIAIDQKSISTNPRSTVGTVTEIYDYLRLLYARVGRPKCPTHGIPVASQTPQQIVDEIMSWPRGTKIYILAPMARQEKGEYLAEFQKWMRRGFIRARIDGKWQELEKAERLAKHKRHDIDLLIDRLTVDEKFRNRIVESVNLSIGLTKGSVSIENVDTEKAQLFSIHRACPECGYSFPALDPRNFSFNNPRGACETCNGLGTLDVSEDGHAVVDDEEESDGIDEYSIRSCPDCKGQRLKKESLNVFVDDKNIAELSHMSVWDLGKFFKGLKLDTRDKTIADRINQQITNRLSYLDRVGTGYLSLDRPTRTLSGGEAQRLRLAVQVGSSLVGVLYVLDEPSIGLHPRDHERLLSILHEMKDRGNTIIVVEHDEETIRSADYLVDLGPGAGRLGGVVMAQGKPSEVEKNPQSITGQYLSHKKRVPIPSVRRPGNGNFLEVLGATGNNLKNVDVKIPMGTLCGITGVSGSGKSTLIIDTLYKELAKILNSAKHTSAPFERIRGIEHIDKIVEINQKPIGRTPRSTPATYVGLLPLVREHFAMLPESKIRGYPPGYFSFNVKGGRCEVCEGGGQRKIEMHFMADVYVKCESCQGKRYNPEILSIKWKDKSIADVLAMTVAEAAEFFRNHKVVYKKLETLKAVGMDYMSLGQSSTTLSGGEAQRVKLSRELSKRATGKTLYILDEPTTGLHFEDVKKLIELLQELVTQGNTVLVIEHNLEVIKSCDHVVDLGPDGGVGGGKIVGSGTPEFIAKTKGSETGRFLKKVLEA